MIHRLALAVLALVVLTAPAGAAGITGQYIEARTCEVFTGPCFANADTGLTGKHGVMAWKIEEGTLESVKLDGLSVVAVVAASDTLGLRQTGVSKAVVFVDSKATKEQRAALVALAKNQGGDLVRNVVAVHSAPISFDLCECKDG